MYVMESTLYTWVPCGTLVALGVLLRQPIAGSTIALTGDSLGDLRATTAGRGWGLRRVHVVVQSKRCGSYATVTWHKITMNDAHRFVTQGFRVYVFLLYNLMS